MVFVNLLSLILFSMIDISLWWSILSKHFEISPSITHWVAWNFSFTLFRAVWQPLFGLKPCEQSRKVGSKIASRINRMASCTILSLGGAIVKGLVPPEALGISILLLVENLNVSFFSFSDMFGIVSLEIPSKVSGGTPGVIFPGLLLIFSYAYVRSSSLYNRGYNGLSIISLGDLSESLFSLEPTLIQ